MVVAAMVSIEAARATLRAREELQRSHGRERARRILDRLPRVVRSLRDAGATRIVLFGSLATDAPRSSSDLDLAVTGLPLERYFSALAEAMRLAGCPVDLVRLEDAADSLRARISSEGREL
jgi:predicted nucleotidyltransferase